MIPERIIFVSRGITVFCSGFNHILLSWTDFIKQIPDIKFHENPRIGSFLLLAFFMSARLKFGRGDFEARDFLLVYCCYTGPEQWSLSWVLEELMISSPEAVNLETAVGDGRKME